MQQRHILSTAAAATLAAAAAAVAAAAAAAAAGLLQVLLPPSLTEEDLKPASHEERIHPEVTQRLRRRQSSEESPTEADEQRLASIDGTVNMQRSARDPRLPGMLHAHLLSPFILSCLLLLLSLYFFSICICFIFR